MKNNTFKKLVLIILFVCIYVSFCCKSSQAISLIANKSYSFMASRGDKNYITQDNLFAKVDSLKSIQFKSNATFKVTSGLADSKCISFEPISLPGYYLIYKDDKKLYFEKYEDKNSFKQRATFCVEKGLSNPKLISFKPYNDQSSYIRMVHNGSLLIVDDYNQIKFEEDATFSIEKPLLTKIDEVKAKNFFEKGREFEKQGKLFQAIKFFKKGLQNKYNLEINRHIKELSIQIEIARTLRKQAEKLIARKEYNKGLALLNESLEYFKDQNLISYISQGKKEIPKHEKVSSITTGKYLLFDGKDFKNYFDIKENDNFKKYAKLENGSLNIHIPDGKGWTKTGLISKFKLFDFSTSKQSKSYKITFNFGKNTSDFRILLGNIIRITYNKASNKMVLWDGQYSDYYSRWYKLQDISINECPSSVSVFLEPGGFTKVALSNGTVVQRVLFKKEYDKDMGFHILAAPSEKNKAASLSLKKIIFEEFPFEQVKFDQFDYVSPGEILFKGEINKIWAEYEDQGKFANHVKFQENEIIVSVPEKNGRARCGIQTRRFFWLDELQSGGHVDIVIDYDPKKTDGIAVALDHRPYIWNIDQNSVILYWKKIPGEEKRSIISIYVNNSKIIEEKIKNNEIKQVICRIKNGEVSFIGKDGFEKTILWNSALPFSLVHLYLFSEPYQYGQAAKMAIKRVWLLKKEGQNKARPFRSVLAKNTLFSPEDHDSWEFWNINNPNQPDNFISFSDEGLLVDVPEKSGTNIGLNLKPKKWIYLDQRFHYIPIKFTVELDPYETNKIMIGFSTTYNRQRWVGGYDLKGLIFEKGDETASLKVLSSYDWILKRSLPNHILDAWDGTLDIYFYPKPANFMKVCICDDYCITEPLSYFEVDNELNLIIFTPLGRLESAKYAAPSGKFLLKNIYYQWQLEKWPKGMKKWFFIPDKDFEPGSFLNELLEMTK